MNDDVGYDDMPHIVQRGYDAGQRFMEVGSAADVYDFAGKKISEDLPYVFFENSDDWIKGFNAGVIDFVQDRDVNWYHLFYKINIQEPYED